MSGDSALPHKARRYLESAKLLCESGDCESFERRALAWLEHGDGS